MSLDNMRRQLDAFASEAGFEALDAYFIFGEFRFETGAPEAPETLYTDEGLNYCCDCAESLLARAAAYAATLPDKGAVRGESFREIHRVSSTDLNEEDGSMQCEECHRTLDYALSDSGFHAELGHYESIEFGDRLLPGDAYAIARIIDAIEVAKAEEDNDANDDEADLLDELAGLDLEDEDDLERADEIQAELADIRAAAAEKPPSLEARVTAVADRALALAAGAEPTAPALA